MTVMGNNSKRSGHKTKQLRPKLAQDFAGNKSPRVLIPGGGKDSTALQDGECGRIATLRISVSA